MKTLGVGAVQMVTDRRLGQSRDCLPGQLGLGARHAPSLFPRPLSLPQPGGEGG